MMWDTVVVKYTDGSTDVGALKMSGVDGIDVDGREILMVYVDTDKDMKLKDVAEYYNIEEDKVSCRYVGTGKMLIKDGELVDVDVDQYNDEMWYKHGRGYVLYEVDKDGPLLTVEEVAATHPEYLL